MEHQWAAPILNMHFWREVDPTVLDKQITPSILYEIQGATELDALVSADPSTIDSALLEKSFLNYGVHCLDDRTLQLTFLHPVNDSTCILPRSWWRFQQTNAWSRQTPKHGGRTLQVITAMGCFAVTEIEEGNKIVFEANPNYWGGRPKLDRIEFVYNNDPAALLEQYQHGELDMLAVSADQIKTVQANALTRGATRPLPCRVC